MATADLGAILILALSFSPLMDRRRAWNRCGIVSRWSESRFLAIDSRDDIVTVGVRMRRRKEGRNTDDKIEGVGEKSNAPFGVGDLRKRMYCGGSCQHEAVVICER